MVTYLFLYNLCKLQYGVLVRVAQVDRSSVVTVHECYKTIHQVTVWCIVIWVVMDWETPYLMYMNDLVWLPGENT